MKRTHLTLTALTLLLTLTFTSCNLGEIASAAVTEVAAETPAAPTVKADNTASAGKTARPVSSEPSKMKPSGKLITVQKENFTGFTDLTYEIDGVVKTSEGKEAVLELVKCGAISQKINPNDPQGNFYPNQVMKSAEAITFVANAFSETKIPLDDWYNCIYARLNEDDYPVNFHKLVFNSEKKDYLSENIKLYDYCLMLLYTFEKNTGVVLEPAHKIDKITGAEAYRILRENNILTYGEAPSEGTLLVRHQVAMHV